MKEITLKSGAVLKITLSPFAESRALYQAILEELKPLNIGGEKEFSQLFKDLVCTGFSSRKVEFCLETCFKRCTYKGINDKDGLKIDKDSFEKEENRQDYIPVCIEVIKENIMPFLKGLFVEYRQFLALIEKNLPQ